MDVDLLAEDRANILFGAWLKSLLRNSPERTAAILAIRHCQTPTKSAKLLANGAFNVCYRVTFENRHRVVVRFTAIGRVLARHEKVEDEVAILKYLAEKTQIPVPKVFGYGTCDLGPYIVMEYIQGNMMSGYLRDPDKQRFSLRPGLHPRVLERAYLGMADVLLELSKPELPLIGGLVRQSEDGSFIVGKRPLTFNMNRISQFSNIALSVFKESTFQSTGDYFEELARQHMKHLELQKNDAIEDTGVVDWEFTYAAPAEFTYAAPWWLLLENPEDWDADLDDFLARYQPKFNVFLQALKERETEQIRRGSLPESGRISTIMETSLDSGLFWVCLASRNSALFDEIYWKFLDPKFFGAFESMEQRLSLLHPDEQVEMDEFVQEKLRQAEEAKLDEHYTVAQLVEL